jgi:serine/threonine-protein kinase RsbW
MLEFHKVIDSKLSEIAALADAMEAWSEGADVPLKSIMEINLMLDELITNIIEHGYGGKAGKRIEVSAVVSTGAVARNAGIAANAQRQLTVVLTDFAKPFNLLDHYEADTTASLEDREIGGLGIHFVKKLADYVGYDRTELTNVVTIRKALASA